MRDLADYINLGDNTFVTSTTTTPPPTTKPSGPSGQVIYYGPKPKPISEVPEASRSLIVAYDVAAVLNAPCPWSAANKAKYDELMASQYVTAQQKVQLRSWASQCIAQAKPISKPSVQTPTMTWTPPTWDFSAVTKPVIKPGVTPSVQTVLPPPSPSQELKPTITAPTPSVSRPVLDLDSSTKIEEMERQRVERQEQQKKELEKLRDDLKAVQIKVKKPLDVIVSPVHELTYTSEKPISVQVPRMPKVPKKVVTKVLARPIPDVVGVSKVTKGKESKAKNFFGGVVDWAYNKGLESVDSKFVKSEKEDRQKEFNKKLEKWARNGTKTLLKYALKLADAPMSFEVPADVVFSDYEALSAKAYQKWREARVLAEKVNYAGMGLGVVSADWITGKLLEVTPPEYRDFASKDPQKAIITSAIEQFKLKYASALRAAAEGVLNPTKTEAQQLRSAQTELGPLYNQLHIDMENFVAELVNSISGAVSTGGSPGGEVIKFQQRQLQNELDKKRQYYNQIRVSDEFSAREVLREIKSLEKQIGMLDMQIAQAPKATWTQQKFLEVVAWAQAE